MMTSFAEFYERVIEVIAAILGDWRWATEACNRAEAAGRFDGVFDDPTRWTEDGAERMARVIIAQAVRSSAILPERRRDLLGLRDR